MNDCPLLIRKAAGDESYGLCDLNGKFCLREDGCDCDTYDEIKREEERA